MYLSAPDGYDGVFCRQVRGACSRQVEGGMCEICINGQRGASILLDEDGVTPVASRVENCSGGCVHLSGQATPREYGACGDTTSL